MGLKLIFLIVTRAVSLLNLSRREWWWKDAEILMLRHQLAVTERERPRAHSRLTWPDRAWLALLAGTVPPQRLAAMRLIVTPGTILRWQRDIVRRRWAHVSRRGRSGRPATHREVPSVVLRLARENESWGYRRIHGELAGLGITVAPSTVWQILKSAGIDRAPRRDGPGWAEFLRSQAQGILALDFFAADLLNGTKVYVLAVIEHGTRRIRILGATGHPVQSWVVQQARNLLMDLEDAGTRAKFVLHDRDASFTATFDSVFQAAGIRVIRSAVQAPRMNSVMERWIGSCRRELLDRTLWGSITGSCLDGLARLGSSLSDHFGRLPARALSARLPDGADPAPGVQGCRAPGGAPRGAVVPNGGGRPLSPCRRSGGVKLEAA